MENQSLSRKNLKTATMVKVSLLGAISFVFMALSFTIPIFPAFLKFDISDIPSLIAGFALGPIAGIMVQFIKNIMNVAIMGTTTGGVGELSNFVIGSSFVATAALIYKHHKGIKSAIIACICGTLVMTILGVFSNYFVMLPLYSKFIPMDKIVQMGSVVNPAIKDTFTLVLYGIVPFNIFKGLSISALTMLIYKKISILLKR
ncbi:MAG: ECF transporter S component [Peptoanaerobacter stomatis]|uniref:ECF transporter S component n=1 Tax=Peptoanaerobacter stomatis TaxID=796937 RepID=UPI003FA162A5